MKRIILFATICVICSSAFSKAKRDWSSVQSWVYQLCDYKDNKLDGIVATDFDLAVIDLSRDGGADYFIVEEISRLKVSGKIALAYFSIGSIETFRPKRAGAGKAGIMRWPFGKSENWYLVLIMPRSRNPSRMLQATTKDRVCALCGCAGAQCLSAPWVGGIVLNDRKKLPAIGKYEKRPLL